MPSQALVSWMSSCFYWVGSLESEISLPLQVHNGFLDTLLPTAVSLHGNQCSEVQLRVSGMRQLRIRVSSAHCRGPGLLDVAVTDTL